MEGLLKAISDVLAALFGAMGFVGRRRLRAGIQEDLDLLDRLQTSSAFGPESEAHRHLAQSVTEHVTELAGASDKKRRPWSSVVMALVVGLPLVYWTYTLDKDGFTAWSLLPGIFGGLMVIAGIALVFETESEAKPASESGLSTQRQPDA